MSMKNAGPRNGVVQPTKYVWVAVATLIVCLILGAFVAAPWALATAGPDSDLPFGLQSGLVTAHLDPSGHVVGKLDLVGGPGLPFGLQSGLVTAHLDPSGHRVSKSAGVQRGIDADAARYQVMGAFYLAKAEAGWERAINADSARWQALGRFQAGGSAELPYTDVSQFYAERMRAQAKQASSTLPYTDVSRFYAERMRAQARQRSELAANPELILARRAYVPQSELAANPELILARRAYVALGAQSELAANPELILARRPYIAPSAQSELAANPELILARRPYIAPSAQSELAANPELILARRYYTQGALVCSAGSC